MNLPWKKKSEGPICTHCEGKKKVYREGEDCNGQFWSATVDCHYCKGTGRPGKQQLEREEYGRLGGCLDCGLDPVLHEDWDGRRKGFPYGCLRAALHEIRELKAKAPK